VSEGTPFRFSDSISYDAKIGNIKDNIDLYNKASCLIVGSSVGLNNIDSETIESLTDIEVVFNVSSWGLKSSEVLQLLKLLDLDSKKCIIYAAQHTAFDKKRTKIINEFEIKKYINKSFSFYPYYKTMSSLLENIGQYINWRDIYMNKNSYKYLGFDKRGDVNYEFGGYHIDKDRWNDPGKTSELSDESYQELLNINAYLSNKDIDFYFVRTPYREEVLNADEILYDEFRRFGVVLEELAGKYSFKFVDSHKLLLDDSHFVDKSHLNKKGAIQVSKLISVHIKMSLKNSGIMTENRVFR